MKTVYRNIPVEAAVDKASKDLGMSREAILEGFASQNFLWRVPFGGKMDGPITLEQYQKMSMSEKLSVWVVIPILEEGQTDETWDTARKNLQKANGFKCNNKMSQSNIFPKNTKYTN